MLQDVTLTNSAGSFQLHDTTASSLVEADGLMGIPKVRGEVVERPEAHGVIEPSRQWMAERGPILTGDIFGTTVDAARASWGSLAKILLRALNEDTILTWTPIGSSITLRATVRLADECEPVYQDGAPIVSYQIHLRAADPQIYDDDESTADATDLTVSTGGLKIPLVFPLDFGTPATGGALTVDNDGNAEAWPEFEITGPISGPIINNATQGLSISFPNLTLASDQVLIVRTNPQTRGAWVVTADGPEVPYGDLDYLASTFFYVNPGASETIRFYGSSGGYGDTTAMTATWRDAFVS